MEGKPNRTSLSEVKAENERIGSVMVVGAGIAGIQASLDLADSGYKVHLVEKSPVIGGIMAQLDKTFPTNDCSMCIVSPKLVDCARHININLLTCSEVEEVAGIPGNFVVKVRKHTRYVDEAQCTGCGECAKVCPVTRPNDFDQGLAERNAIYRPLPQATPNVFSIEKKGTSPCTDACPAGCNAHGYVALIRSGKFKEAIELIRKAIPLPAICGRVCGFCEDECNRSNVDEAIKIRALKRFAADYEVKHPELTEESLDIARREKVAIIGSGPAGLTAAHDMAQKGFRPVIFEALGKAGGMLRVGIPEYRLPDDILDYEIGLIEKAGVEIRVNTPAGADLTLEELFKQGYKAVFVAVGTHKSRQLRIAGEDLGGVIHGVDYLRQINLGAPSVDVKNKVVAVIGGGNTAMDTVRSAFRLGAADAFILYRRSREQMPVSLEELEAAEAEGIKIHYLLSPIELKGADGQVTELVCNRMRLGAPDDSGRRRPVPIEGEVLSFDVDIVMPALGQTVEYSLLNEAVGDLAVERDLIKVDPVSLETNIPGVFAGGDAAGSGGYVVHAIAHGHRAAVSMERHILSQEMHAGREEPKVRVAAMPAFPDGKLPAPDLPMLSVEQRSKNFREMELGLSEEEAIQEAGRCLDCGVCCECLQCVDACEANAIDHAMQDTTVALDVGAIVLSPGCELSDFSRLHRLGYGKHEDIITSLQFERILSASGPYSGHIQRLSDGKEPKRIAFIQCAGSRDRDNEYCSGVCCMYALKEAIIAMEHDPDISCEIFYMDIRAYGKGFDAYYERAKEIGVRFTRCRPQEIARHGENGDLQIVYTDAEGVCQTKDFDMVVLSAGFQPLSEVHEFAERFGIALDDRGFALSRPFDPVASTRDGVFVLGPFSEPKDIPETVTEASSASSRAMEYLSLVRGTQVEELELPPERDVAGEPPRIGVFVCHCGKNIGGFLDVPDVAEYAKSLPYVAFADDNLYTCSSDTQTIMKEMIIEHRLNRVVVSSCSPRTHEPLFQETIREAGLNHHLFEMANIRDQCSWVHMHDRDAATQKAKDLVRMAVTKVGLSEPLSSIPLQVTQKALVVGGGVAGMASALSIADQGYEVSIVEKTDTLGGIAQRIDRSVEGYDVVEYLQGLRERVLNHKLINVFVRSQLSKVDGFVGNFTSTIESRNGDSGEAETHKFDHGVAVLATGGMESTPDEYLYGSSPGVRTLLELTEDIADPGFNVPDSVVMIQCVGSREPDHMYCSRVCCTAAIKNAIRMKEMKPQAQVYILYREIRTYGFREKYYTRAREMGIIFVRYDLDSKPVVVEKDRRMMVSVRDQILQADLAIPADMLVLSSRIDPNPDNEQLSQLFKVPINSEKFLLEAHVKLKPVEFATDGVYLCGLAHYPKDIKETVAQATAASSRAATVLSKETFDAAGKISYVNEMRCSGCGACVAVCAYNAITVDENRAVAVINEALCKGCGACAATCRGSAIMLHGFEDKQIIEMIGAL
jgi:heterodisulfide reductase subunit A-like polyferredoxin